MWGVGLMRLRSDKTKFTSMSIQLQYSLGGSTFHSSKKSAIFLKKCNLDEVAT